MEINFSCKRSPRISILQAGHVAGGYCVIQDPYFIAIKEINETKIIHAARQVNDAKPD